MAKDVAKQSPPVFHLERPATLKFLWLGALLVSGFLSNASYTDDLLTLQLDQGRLLK